MPALYDPRAWKITWKGIDLTGCFAPDTFLKVTRNNASASMVEGADGGTTIVAGASRSGKVEFSARREHPVNIKLSNALNQFERGELRRGIGEFFAENTISGTTASAENAVIEKQPDLDGAASTSPIVWAFLLDDVTIFNGASV